MLFILCALQNITLTLLNQTITAKIKQHLILTTFFLNMTHTK